MYQTVEYQEADRKLMELSVIEEKLEDARTRIKRDNKKLNWCILLTSLLLLLMFILAISYGTSEPDYSI